MLSHPALDRRFSDGAYLNFFEYLDQDGDRHVTMSDFKEWAEMLSGVCISIEDIEEIFFEKFRRRIPLPTMTQLFHDFDSEPMLSELDCKDVLNTLPFLNAKLVTSLKIFEQMNTWSLAEIKKGNNSGDVNTNQSQPISKRNSVRCISARATRPKHELDLFVRAALEIEIISRMQHRSSPSSAAVTSSKEQKRKSSMTPSSLFSNLALKSISSLEMDPRDMSREDHEEEEEGSSAFLSGASSAFLDEGSSAFLSWNNLDSGAEEFGKKRTKQGENPSLIELGDMRPSSIGELISSRDQSR